MIDQEYLERISLPKKVYDRIENDVNKLFHELNYKKVPIDPLDIAKRLDYILVPYSALTTEQVIELRKLGLDGTSFFNPKTQKYEIYYDDIFQKLARQRFTVSHEIGHIRLGHKQESALAKKMADYYAAYLLAPSPLMSNCESYLEVRDRFYLTDQCAYACFDRLSNWMKISGWKPYEIEILIQFDHSLPKGVDYL
ncbi:MAG: ImmA/IrrE family metallo-endopeptidase [Erysipelotrichaceae bacterium]|nr:ImmA/IrrE family metallo-endopeptidase [Erysipelotrichaceae bacterium]